MKGLKTMKKTIIKALALTMVCGGLVASSVQAASYKATGGESGSYTKAVGPGSRLTYEYAITGKNGGSFLIQIKDPFLWHDQERGIYTKPRKARGISSGGSQGAYWRGRIVNGWIKVTV